MLARSILEQPMREDKEETTGDTGRDEVTWTRYAYTRTTNYWDGYIWISCCHAQHAIRWNERAQASRRGLGLFRDKGITPH